MFWNKGFGESAPFLLPESRGEKVLLFFSNFSLILYLRLSGQREQGHSYCAGPSLCCLVWRWCLSFLSLPLSLLFFFLLRCRWPHLQVNWNSWRYIISFLLLTHICLEFFFFFFKQQHNLQLVGPLTLPPCSKSASDLWDAFAYQWMKS